MSKVDPDAVARIGHHRLVRQAFCAYQVQQAQRDLTFGLCHLRFGWHMHRLHPLWLADPGLRQVQAQRQGVVAQGCGVVQRHGDLAVVGLAQRPGVLPRDTHRVTTFLRKAGVVDDDHSRRIGQRLRQQLPIAAQDRLLVPVALIDEQLQRLLGIAVPARHADALTQRLDTLALAVQEQTLEIDLCPIAAGDDPEVGSELGDVLLESLANVRFQLDHRCAPHVATLQLDRKVPVVRLTSRRRHNITSRRSSTRNAAEKAHDASESWWPRS